MGLLTSASRRRRADTFPNYALLEPRDIVAQAEQKTRKLESIYHLSQKHAWDGRKVLSDLLEKHGGIDIPEEKREAIARVFSIILWGELAAWIVSAELAENIDDVEAKMAATSQTFDEARHFYVMRDYLNELGVEIPPLDAYSRVVLREVLDTDNLAFKLVGMQLLVENVALSLFKMVAKARIEPVLSDLMPYFEKDEARHVGLGINYLPKLIEQMSWMEVARLNVYQARIYTLLFWGSMLQREDFDELGLDANDSTRFGLRTQLDIATRMGKFGAGDGQRVGRGVYVEPEFIRKTHSFSIDAFMPHPGAEISGWQRRVLGVARRAARAGARVMDAVDA
ncbi:MAG: ferritin-like domain-containing protein [Polyangiales bacterium]